MNQTENNRPLVDGVPALERKLEEVRRAQEQFATFSQEQVDGFSRQRLWQPITPDCRWQKWLWKKPVWVW